MNFSMLTHTYRRRTPRLSTVTCHLREVANRHTQTPRPTPTPVPAPAPAPKGAGRRREKVCYKTRMLSFGSKWWNLCVCLLVFMYGCKSSIHMSCIIGVTQHPYFKIKLFEVESNGHPVLDNLRFSSIAIQYLVALFGKDFSVLSIT